MYGHYALLDLAHLSVTHYKVEKENNYDFVKISLVLAARATGVNFLQTTDILRGTLPLLLCPYPVSADIF